MSWVVGFCPRCHAKKTRETWNGPVLCKHLPRCPEKEPEKGMV